MDISEIAPDSRHEKLVLIVLDFLGKTYYVKNGVNREFLGAKMTPELFYKSVHWVFVKFYQMTSLKIWFKVTVVDFEGKFILCWNFGKIGQKPTLLNF